MKYVNVYEVSQCYGGPEEGGWWFTAGELLETIGPVLEEEARDLSRAIIEEDKTKVKEYMMGFSSTDGCDADGNGDDSYLLHGGGWGEMKLQTLVQDKPGDKFFPSERPYHD